MGVSIRYCFEAWVNFLIAATTPKLMVIAVFDDPTAVRRPKFEFYAITK